MRRQRRHETASRGPQLAAGARHAERRDAGAVLKLPAPVAAQHQRVRVAERIVEANDRGRLIGEAVGRDAGKRRRDVDAAPKMKASSSTIGPPAPKLNEFCWYF